MVKSFGPTPALRGATIAVGRGEILAVMGPSGSGKSTLLHCLAGILAPDEGEVWFAASRLDTLREDKRSDLRRDRFGFVFQFGQLVPELTAEENVALPLLLNGIRRGPALAEARPWFGTLGLDGLERRRSGELSGGQAQRVALARGLVAGPEVLFADEPTGSLDSLSGELVMKPADRRRPRAGHHGHPGHPRGPGRRLRRPRGRRPRRHGQLAHRVAPVISLGLRLAISGGREAVIRLVILAAAVGLGVGLLLTAVCPASTRSTRRTTVMRGSGPERVAGACRRTRQPGTDPLWWRISGDDVRRPADRPRRGGRHRPDVTGAAGHSRDPAPGQYYASPALARLLHSTPADELADRYPGRLAGTIGDAALPSPDSLVIIIGRTAAQMARTPDTVAGDRDRDHAAGQLRGRAETPGAAHPPA